MGQYQNKQRHKPHSAVMTIALCFLIALSEGIDLQTAGVAAPGIAATFGLDKSSLGLFFSAAVLGLLPGGLIGGRLADRIGRQKVLIISVTVFGFFSIATAWVNSFWLLLCIRFMTGLGMGAALPNLVALVSEVVSEQARGRAISFMYCGMPVGGIIISLLASKLATTDWKIIFYVGGTLPLITIPFMLLFLPESPAFLSHKSNPDTAQPLRFKTLFNPDFRLATTLLWVGYFFTMLVVYVMFNWLPSVLMELGFQNHQANIVQMFFAIGAFFGTLGLGLLIDHWKMNYVIIMMYSGIVVGLLALSSFKVLYSMYFAAALVGCFTIGAQMVLYAIGSQVYPTQIRGTGLGSAMSIGRVGAILGPALVGQFMLMGNGLSSVIFTSIPSIVIAAILILALSRNMHKQGHLPQSLH